MMRTIMSGLVALVLAAPAFAQSTPSAAQIERSLSQGAPVAKHQRVRRGIIKQRPDLRRIAPSIEIQSINFAFGSANIGQQELWKVEAIAVAMRRILRRNRREVFLLEGHTDAVGSHSANQLLSERRAAALKRALVRHFRIPSRAIDTVGYGEDFLLVNTPRAEWRNRRVTIRRITDFILY